MATADLIPLVDPPRGLWPAKVDDKGRLKLPTHFGTYLIQLQATKVFVTSWDNQTAKVYTIPAWEKTVALLMSGENKQFSRDLILLAQINGQDVEPDQQGRVLLPTGLRRQLGLENASVQLVAEAGVITIYSEQVIEEQRRRALENLPAKVEYAQALGCL